MMRQNKFVGMIVTVTLIAAMASGCGKKTAETAVPETVPVTVEQTLPAAVETQPVASGLVVEAIEEQGDTMLVRTSFVQVKYPFAFADLIQVRPVNGDNVDSLEFFVASQDEEHPIFTLHFGGNEGILLGTLQISNEETPRTLYAELASADTEALGDYLETFYAAQESFNDVVASLAENTNFTAAN